MPSELPVLLGVLSCPDLAEDLDGGQLREPRLDRGVDRSQQLIAVGTDGGRQFEALLFGLR